MEILINLDPRSIKAQVFFENLALLVEDDVLDVQLEFYCNLNLIVNKKISKTSSLLI